MKAEDTVMSNSAILTAIGKKHYERFTIEEVAKAQAELSFKAGIKEVAGWLDKPCPHTGGLEEQQMFALDCRKCWEDAKKEWGMDDAKQGLRPHKKKAEKPPERRCNQREG